MTINQHYVPCAYLYGFSEDYVAGLCPIDPKRIRKSPIWYYNLSKNEQSSKAVPIDTQSYLWKKYLYELDLSNNVKMINAIENNFCLYESKYNMYRKRIKDKLSTDRLCKCFLTFDEKDFWKLWVWQQILRHPIPFNRVKPVIEGMCTLQGEKVKKEDAHQIFDYIPLTIMNMSIAVGYDKTFGLVTSDMPVFIYPDDSILFPVSSDLLLVLFNNDSGRRSNILFDIDDDMREAVLITMKCNARMFLYSGHPFSETELDLIRS